MSDFALAPCTDDVELSRVLDIVSGALHFERSLADRFVDVSGREHFRALRRRDQDRAVVGGLVIHPMGQYFGGRVVPMGGIGGVGIAPEHRSGGAATAMMNLAVTELRERGVPLSALYPATVPVYRRAGYELAGNRFEIRIPLRQMPVPRQSDELSVKRIDESDRPAVESLYIEQAKRSAGALHRGPFSWRRVYEPRGEKATGYKVVNERGEMEGVVFLLQKDAAPPAGARNANPPLFTLLVNEVQISTARAGRRILELLRQHRSVSEEAVLYGSPDHPLLALIPERTFLAQHQFHWMLRIVDVDKALAARGWNPAIRCEMAFAVDDDLIPDNRGVFRLSIADGEAHVERGTSANIAMDVRGLAALYTGHMTPNDLVNMGYLRQAGAGKSGNDMQRDMKLLAGAFAGPRPFMSDMF